MKTADKNILRRETDFKVNGSLWLEYEGKRLFGPGPVELLELIEQNGSISQAAKQMNMSYKKAWEIINRLNTNAETPLVITSQGGEHGGGSSISKEARKMIIYYSQLRVRFQQFLEHETIKIKAI